ncbi:uncharacterized protein RJT20DRAFT_137221 [Scheffersomyces xylosifermentans]|uniref:uncharacterized protein n=1 Tax=Scheffersomyces xylosifermentans TaxID=1304137 RepID=UPI00315D55E1
MNGNFNSGIQQSASAQFPAQQPYASYYMMNQQAQPQGAQSSIQGQQSTQQQQSTPSQQQATQSQAQQGNPQAQQSSSNPSDQYYVRYQASYGAPPNYSMYQQPIPGQLSQPQPTHYNQLGSGSSTAASGAYGAGTAASGAVASANSNTQSTPIQDTLNSASNSTVGQYQPPGIRPRVTTTMWEDEKTLCYQVDANNVSVVRRADNNMINGTKLLNVAQMTRGRRDGILKSEKVRHVVKIGSMHLKGVWIPFERALAMAQREGIVDLLYPLFVRDIKRVIQTGVTPSGSGAAAAAAGGAAVGPKTASTPTPAAQPSLNNFYQQYNQQYGQQYANPQVNGTAGTAVSASSTGASNTTGATSASASAAGQQSPQQAATSTASDSYQLQFQQAAVAAQQSLPQQQQQQQQQQPQQQQQVYGYQQPYYAAPGAAPNQYYQQYNTNPSAANYSAYSSQPVYSYGYVNQLPHQMPPQQSSQQPQQSQPQHSLGAQSSGASVAATSNGALSAGESGANAEKKEDK